ncbi:MAG: SH3 domain-containing protein [Chitinophagaceae bacterium]|nr:SH3 domain-containing protein [Chitinophagaceae bacterium]
MDYAVISVPAAPVRRKPNHRKEMVNQLLFGETVKVLYSKNELWVKIRSLHDGYEG